MFKKFIFIILLSCLFLSACQEPSLSLTPMPSDQPSPTPAPAPSDLPSPTPDITENTAPPTQIPTSDAPATSPVIATELKELPETNEGLIIGDSFEKMIEMYGENYTKLRNPLCYVYRYPIENEYLFIFYGFDHVNDKWRDIVGAIIISTHPILENMYEVND